MDAAKKRLVWQCAGYSALGAGFIPFYFFIAPFLPLVEWHTQSFIAWIFPREEVIRTIGHLPASDSGMGSSKPRDAFSLVAAAQEALLREQEVPSEVLSGALEDVPPEVFERIRVAYERPEPKKIAAYRLVIPGIHVDMPLVINESNAQTALLKGAWRVPNTAEPGQKGNMVVSAHRFLYEGGSRSLYHLDKVAVGDEIVVYWDNKRYTYLVTENTVVQPEEVEVLDQTDDTRLTIFTCDPPYSTAKRRVVVAVPIS